MTREIDENYLRQAIALAKTGRGITEPNPSVACILVKDGRIIGQGRTQGPGKNHAEPEALANCTEDPRGATAYVTLEPCCHTNKRTPPCCPRLISAGISRVVLGKAIDPTPEVNGNGIKVHPRIRRDRCRHRRRPRKGVQPTRSRPFIATTRFAALRHAQMGRKPPTEKSPVQTDRDCKLRIGKPIASSTSSRAQRRHSYQACRTPRR